MFPDFSCLCNQPYLICKRSNDVVSSLWWIIEIEDAISEQPKPVETLAMTGMDTTGLEPVTPTMSR
jgi:hypothetical protein